MPTTTTEKATTFHHVKDCDEVIKWINRPGIYDESFI